MKPKRKNLIRWQKSRLRRLRYKLGTMGYGTHTAQVRARIAELTDSLYAPDTQSRLNQTNNGPRSPRA